MKKLSSRDLLVLVAAGGSAALLAGAFFFQLNGYPPCAMCIWQRWPHAAAVLIGVIVLRIRARVFTALGALAALATSAIGLFHSGVEQHWWQGPTSCTGNGGGLGSLSGSDLLSTANTPKLVMCDQISWAFAGLSMASWNAILSLLIAGVWVAAYRRS